MKKGVGKEEIFKGQITRLLLKMLPRKGVQGQKDNCESPFCSFSNRTREKKKNQNKALAPGGRRQLRKRASKGNSMTGINRFWTAGRGKAGGSGG